MGSHPEIQEQVKRWVVSLADERDWVAVAALGASLVPIPPLPFLGVGLGILELERIKRRRAPLAARSFATWAILIGLLTSFLGVAASVYSYGKVTTLIRHIWAPLSSPSSGYQPV